MQFNTVEFLVFFTAFFAVYWSLRRWTAVQNGVLLAASYLFYGWWDWRFLGLILVTTVTTWGTALMSVRARRQPARRAWSSAGIAVNLAILLAFKYFNFFSENLSRLLGAFGWNVDWVTVDVLLPVGISFYTFQAISYQVDVYRGTLRPVRDPVVFATYIAFFPQLLAGPIERGSALLGQLAHSRRWHYDLAVRGARELLWGLFKKVAVADVCGVYVDIIYGADSASPVRLAVASVLFLLQIYCDFSGYCNMARGLAAMLGVRLSVNFRYPLFSRSVADFWHRWHITLMTWFRDYVYIPLGGSRRSTGRTCVNIMVVFLLSGLWHGASWNFVLWGALWGAAMVVERLMRGRRYGRRDVPAGSPADLLRIAATLFVATLIFAIFRADTATQGCLIVARSWIYVAAIYAALLPVVIVGCRAGRRAPILLGVAAGVFVVWTWFTAGAGQALAYVVMGGFPAAVVALIAGEWSGRRLAFPLQGLSHYAVTPVRWAIYFFLILAVIFSNSTGQQFIYYQF